VKEGEQRFVMSLRATGEGHISSIVFQTGIVDDKARITLERASGYFTSLQKRGDSKYSKEFISKRAATAPGLIKAFWMLCQILFWYQKLIKF
jgi:hypothetical protein